MWHPNVVQLRILKCALFFAALLPAMRLLLGGVQNSLGANPIEFITRNSGDWALYFLFLTLAITPIRRCLHLPWLIKLRRMLGLFCFFYASIHFLAFFWFDHFFDLDDMLRDVFKRPFILLGMLGFVLLIPLAVTSTHGMIRRLGGKLWQALHRLVYLVAMLGVVHYWWMKAGKNDFGQPILFAMLLAVLLGVRLYWRWQDSRRGVKNSATGLA